jgi:predicted mannosyl-3-phosphoglycerate phosphatase (HAD superfamily)
MSVERSPQSPRIDPTILVLTCIDGALRAVDAGSCAPVRQPVSELAARNVAVILTSHHSRGELAVIQEEIGIQEPFVAENGKSLCVPKGYFARLPALSDGDGSWEVIEFDPPSLEDAIEMLMWLYRVSGNSPLLVGVGTSWRDHLLLRHVDVPVVVRNPAIDQRELRAHFPRAFVTSLTGPDGWIEALLGVSLPGVDRKDSRP